MAERQNVRPYVDREGCADTLREFVEAATGRRCDARFYRYSGARVRCPYVSCEVVGHEALCRFHALERAIALDEVALCDGRQEAIAA